VRVIALASLVLFPSFMTYPLLVSLGRIRDTLTSSLIALPPTMLVLIGSAFIGLHAVAASLFLTAPFQVYVALSFVRRHVSFKWSELALAIRKSAVVTMCAAVAPAATVAVLGFRLDLSVPEGAMAGTGAVLGWLVGLALTKHPLLAELRDVADVARQAIISILPTRRGW
jgi:O-antigen/teichoic acid export membrane protein